MAGGRMVCAGRLEAVSRSGRKVLAARAYRVRRGTRASITLRLSRRARATAVAASAGRKVLVRAAQEGRTFTLGLARVAR